MGGCGGAIKVKRREISLCAGRPFIGVKAKKKSVCSVRNDGRVWRAEQTVLPCRAKEGLGGAGIRLGENLSPV
jgi:hypothetical protein